MIKFETILRACGLAISDHYSIVSDSSVMIYWLQCGERG